MAVAHAADSEELAHQRTGFVQRLVRIVSAQRVAEAEHEGVACLGELARADVDGGADGAVALAVHVEQALALGGDPADQPVVVADRPVLHVVGRADGGIEGRAERPGGGVPVFGMEAIVEVVERADGVGREAEHDLGARRPGQCVGGEIHVPDADLGRFGRQPERFLVQQGLALRVLVGRDVVAAHEDAVDLAGLVAHRLIEEVDEARAGVGGEANLHGAGNEALARSVNAVE